MKKIFIYLFGLLIAFASCAKVTDMSFEDLRDETPQEVVFQLDAVKTTKAVVNTIADFKEDFGVYGYIYYVDANGSDANHFVPGYILKNSKYYGNADPTKLGTGYTKTYWPKSDKDDIIGKFAAYYPYDAGTDNNTPLNLLDDGFEYAISLSSANIDVTKADATSKVTDVMYAINNTGYTPVYPKVIDNNLDVAFSKPTLEFKHALSLLQFQVKVQNLDDITKVNIKNIQFYDANDQLYAIYTGGKLKITRDANDNNNFKLSTNAESAIDVTNGTNSTIDFATPSTTTNFATTAKDSYKAIGTSVIIPQAVPAKVKLTYSIELKYKEGNNTINTIEYQERTVTRVINTGGDENNVAFPTTWKSGWQYIYRYYITVDEIKFTVSVVNWDNATNYYQVWDIDGTNSTIL